MFRIIFWAHILAYNLVRKIMVQAAIITVNASKFWAKVIVQVKVRKIPREFIGNYQKDLVFREKFQKTLNQLWKEKDELIDKVLAENSK